MQVFVVVVADGDKVAVNLVTRNGRAPTNVEAGVLQSPTQVAVRHLAVTTSSLPRDPAGALFGILLHDHAAVLGDKFVDQAVTLMDVV